MSTEQPTVEETEPNEDETLWDDILPVGAGSWAEWMDR